MMRPMEPPELATQQTIGDMLTAIDQKVGRLEPALSGVRHAYFHSWTRQMGRVWLNIQQTPIELSPDRSIAFVNHSHLDRDGGPTGDYTHYNFYSTETGVDLVESRPDLISIDHIRPADYPDMKSYMDKVQEEVARIRAEERAAGLGGVTELRARDLLRAIRRARPRRSS